jgi:hypothetical protein
MKTRSMLTSGGTPLPPRKGLRLPCGVIMPVKNRIRKRIRGGRIRGSNREMSSLEYDYDRDNDNEGAIGDTHAAYLCICADT